MHILAFDINKQFCHAPIGRSARGTMNLNEKLVVKWKKITCMTTKFSERKEVSWGCYWDLLLGGRHLQKTMNRMYPYDQFMTKTNSAWKGKYEILNAFLILQNSVHRDRNHFLTRLGWTVARGHSPSIVPIIRLRETQHSYEAYRRMIPSKTFSLYFFCISSPFF